MVTDTWIRECAEWHDSVINIQSVKSKINVLLYISKDDPELIFNCRLGELSIYYRTLEWARRTPSFRFSDSFAVEHGQYYKLLQVIHFEIWSRQRSKPIVPRVIREWWPGWPVQVLQSF
jgi:hypothetical protein